MRRSSTANHTQRRTTCSHRDSRPSWSERSLQVRFGTYFRDLCQNGWQRSGDWTSEKLICGAVLCIYFSVSSHLDSVDLYPEALAATGTVLLLIVGLIICSCWTSRKQSALFCTCKLEWFIFVLSGIMLKKTGSVLSLGFFLMSSQGVFPSPVSPLVYSLEINIYIQISVTISPVKPLTERLNYAFFSWNCPLVPVPYKGNMSNFAL